MPPDPAPVENQQAVVDWLCDPATHGGMAVRRIDTHGAVVALVGDRAYKLKRAVRFPYMDFSTVDRRRDACRREVTLNRRTAPSIYRDARSIVADGHGNLRFGGPGEDGEAVDWVVVMRRFDETTLFDRMATEGRLRADHLRDLAGIVADFHAAADPRPGEGGSAAVAWVLADNADEMAAMGDVFDRDHVLGLATASRAALDRHRDLIDARSRAGRVRVCHGDLHLRNVCLVDGRPTPFDAIEFNPALSDIDVWYDVAYLLMDLDHRGLRPLANAAFNAYLDVTGDVEGVALLPLFLSMRAAVRAKVGASGAQAQTDPAVADRMRAEARACLDLARAVLEPVPARLVAIGGLSGTGKTTVARALAPALGRAPGAVVVRTDRIRKRLAGVGETDRLPSAAYGPGTAEPVYAAMNGLAAAILATGQAVVADGVHARPNERADIAAVAAAAGVPFDGIWLEVDPAVASARVAARRGDASDADGAVVRLQATFDTGPIAWAHVAADGGADTVAVQAAEILSRH